MPPIGPAIRALIAGGKKFSDPIRDQTAPQMAKLAAKIADKGVLGKVGAWSANFVGKHPVQTALMGLSVWKPWKKDEVELQPGMLPTDPAMMAGSPAGAAAAAGQAMAPDIEAELAGPGEAVAEVAAGGTVGELNRQSGAPLSG